jgi:hypothetical protein
MNYSSIFRISIIAVICLGSLTFISGCGDGLSGHKYAEEGGIGETLEFKSGKQANFTYLGTTYAGTYSVDGNEITIDTAGGPFGKFVITRQNDGSITGLPPLSATVKKQS